METEGVFQREVAARQDQPAKHPLVAQGPWGDEDRQAYAHHQGDAQPAAHRDPLQGEDAQRTIGAQGGGRIDQRKEADQDRRQEIVARAQRFATGVELQDEEQADSHESRRHAAFEETHAHRLPFEVYRQEQRRGEGGETPFDSELQATER
jgi:hypothetical protein